MLVHKNKDVSLHAIKTAFFLLILPIVLCTRQFPTPNKNEGKIFISILFDLLFNVIIKGVSTTKPLEGRDSEGCKDTKIGD